MREPEYYFKSLLPKAPSSSNATLTSFECGFIDVAISPSLTYISLLTEKLSIFITECSPYIDFYFPFIVFGPKLPYKSLISLLERKAF